MPGGMGKDRKTSAPFLFIITANHQNRTDRTVFPHPARTVRRAAARHSNAANKLCTDDSSEQLITLHHKPSPDHRRTKEQNDITLRGRPRWVTAGAVQHRMPDRNNTNQPQSNSFWRFFAAEACQYVYYCLHHVAARQSSRHLAHMQGVRIKACGSFPPQIVLALTSSKNSRRGSRAAPLCGDPEAKSSENLLL